MSEHYDFHYQPTGSGAISGQQVLEQTEDAINELGDYVNDNVGGAMDVAQQALETAQNAEQDAQTALDTANSFSDAIQSAQQDASTALSTAQTAQTTASNANNTAIQAQQDASSAVTTANNASSQVSTLSGTVTALGQRVTTAEGNIGQNTSDITALTTRVGTAEGNITTLQNDVSIAQGNASSAMATAGQVKQQAFVFRYSSTALTASSTNSNTLLDNTDNLKVGDKVIDSNGVLFSITAIDTANSTFTIGTALIDLAQDSDVVHKSGNETITGVKSFSDDTYVKNINFTKEVASSSVSTTSILQLINTVTYTDETASKVAILNFRITADGVKAFYPNENNQYALGLQSQKWSEVRAIQYYYGSSDVEFSTKFVTTDTVQDVTANKNFKGLITTTPDSTLWTINNKTTDDITSLATGCIHIESRATGNLLDLSGGAWCVAQIGTGCFFFRQNNGTDIRYKHFPTNVVSKICVMSNDNKFISDLVPDTTNAYNLGNSSFKWSTINGLNPSALGMPDLDNGIDISSYLTAGNSNNTYTPSVNGWISISIGASSGGLAIFIEQGDMKVSSYSVTGKYQNTDLSCFACLPVVAGVVVNIGLKGSGNYISSAKFFPCQGNV